MQKRPNILFAVADDASHFSAYGHEFVNTPNFDAVAKQGILFNNAFTTNPKCAPSRASILTGMQTWQLEEASCHCSIFPNKFKVYPTLLEETGYFVGHTGKGWAPGDYEAGGFKHNPAGHEYNNIMLVPPTETCISAKNYSANFGEFLAKRPDGVPFCFWYGAHEPHRHYMPGEGLRAGKTTDNVKVPPYWPDTPVVREDMLDYAYETEWFDAHLGKIIAQLKAAGEYENTLIVVTSDNGAPFPRVKGQMYEDDFRLPLAICWPEVIAPGRVVDDLISFVDFAPTFLDIAGVGMHPQFAGKSLKYILTSFDSGYLDSDRDKVLMGREHHDMGREDDLGYPVRCLRTRNYLYVRNFAPERWPAGNPETGFTNCDSSPTKDLILEMHEKEGEEFFYNLSFGKRPLEELYDIKNDSACMYNLAGKPGFRELKEQMWKELESLLREQCDPRIFGNGGIFETYKKPVEDAPHSWYHYLNGTWTKQKY